MRSLQRIYLATIAVVTGVLVATGASAAIIGNWDGSNRSWNSGDATVLHDLMVSRGHTVEADGALTAANLAGDTLFVIGEATRATTAAETADLLSYVMGGGRLLITVDTFPGGTAPGLGVVNGNAILSSLGSSLTFSEALGGSAVNGALQAGSFLTEGGPFDIVGQTLVTTLGAAVTGGTSLAGSYVAFEQIGAGYIFGFGDNFQNDLFFNSATNVNGQMHINLVEGGAATQVPEPSALVLLGIGLLMLALFAKRTKPSVRVSV